MNDHDAEAAVDAPAGLFFSRAKFPVKLAKNSLLAGNFVAHGGSFAAIRCFLRPDSRNFKALVLIFFRLARARELDKRRR
jgi:hypothetical protein